jgi:PAS domain S-box-containing protein
MGLLEVFQRVWRTGQSEHHPVTLYRDQRLLGWRENYVYRLPSGEVVAVYDDITERKRAEEALRESEERFRTVYEKAAMGIAVTDARGKILKANAYFQRMLGRPAEDVVGRTFEEFTHPEEVEAERALFLQAMKEGRTEVQVQKRYIRNDGQIVWANLTASICRDAAAEPRFVIGLVEDITERRQAEAELRELSGQLLRLQDDERQRLARELHDTTAQELAAISMNLAVLKARAPELKAGAQAVLAETAALTDRCASGIRTMSYLLHPPALDALGLAGAGRDYADGFARRSGIRVDLNISDDLGRLPAEIERALFRVLQESLANIHRHSGSRTASICLTRTTGQIRLEVRDTGHGMNISAGLPAGGLGVGIPGMRERMRQFLGQLNIESDAQGTCIIAIVPLDPKTNQP